MSAEEYYNHMTNKLMQFEKYLPLEERTALDGVVNDMANYFAAEDEAKARTTAALHSEIMEIGRELGVVVPQGRVA